MEEELVGRRHPEQEPGKLVPTTTVQNTPCRRCEIRSGIGDKDGWLPKQQNQCPSPCDPSPTDGWLEAAGHDCRVEPDPYL